MKSVIIESTQSFLLNPFMRIQINNPIICSLLLDGKEFALSRIEYVILISEIDKKITYNSLLEKVRKIFKIDDEKAKKIINKLIDLSIFIHEETYNAYDLEGMELWLKRNWLDALPLHLKTKNLEYQDDKNSKYEHSLSYEHDIIPYISDIKESLTIWKDYPKENLRIKLLKSFPLPEDEDFAQILLRRRSGQAWKQESINLQQLSDILFYANQNNIILRKEIESRINSATEDKKEIFDQLFTSSHSALETYFIAFKIDGLDEGLYHYDIKNHEAVLIKKGNFSNEIIEICIGQSSPGSASCVFIFSTIWERYMYRYRHPRAYRNLLIDVADFAHQHILLATTLKLSTWLTPALRDEIADEFLGVNGYIEAPLYVVAIG